MAKKSGSTKAAKNGKKAPAKRIKKAPKPPFRVLVGRISKNGKKYDFTKASYEAADDAMAAAQKAVDAGGDDLREVLILINPVAEVKA